MNTLGIRAQLFLCAVVASTLAAASSAAAQPELTEQERARAREHFERGRELADQGDCNAALGHFQAGYELSGRPLFLFNAGECARQAGRTDVAREHYEGYLEQEPDGEMADIARERLEQLPAPSEDMEDVDSVEDTAPDAAPGPETQTPTPAEAAAASEVARGAERRRRPLAGGESERSVWRSWPLWLSVGVVVAAAVAIPIAITQSGGGGPSCGSNCEIVDFRDAM